MIKKILPLIFLFAILSSKSYSQDFLGLSTGNYTGISGVMLQPASIVDSRYKFDINLFSTGVNYGNNYFLLDRDVILKFNKNKFDDYATFKDRYLSEATLKSGEKAFFNINNRTQLPLSFMASTGRKSAIALNMQFRTMIQGRGISQDVAKLGFNNFFYGPLNNTNIDASGISINSLSWAEVGLTYGRVLLSSGDHFLKGAITGKYLGGLSSISISSNDLRLSVNSSDSTFNFNTSNVSYNHNKNADFDKLFNKNFRPDANTFGLDAGLVYEYRGKIGNSSILKTDDEKSYDAQRRDVNKYIFKLGVSLLDVGMFNFDKPTNVNSFSGNINRWDLRNGHYNSIKEFDTALANRVIPNLNDPRTYNVYLPTALSAQLDVKFVKGLFLNVMSYWPVSLGNEPGKRFDNYGFYTITPRFETRHFGLYIPYTVTQRNELSDYKEHLLGATVRMGPLFIGSSNLGSMLFNKKLKSADVHVGLKVGFTYGKPNKSNRILSSVFKEEKPGFVVEGDKQNTDNEKMKTGKTQSENNVILDYKTGKIYDNAGGRPNITIINNYYYGSTPADRLMDTIAVLRSFQSYADSLQIEVQKISTKRNTIVADSISKVTADSLKIKRQQLDSLIKSMQQLQRQMDNTSKVQANSKADSSVSYILQMNRLQRDMDTLQFKRDSLQAKRGETLMSNTTAYRQDTALSDMARQNEQALKDKKKDNSAQDSGMIKGKSEQLVATAENLKAASDAQLEMDANYSRQLQQMQDSLARMSKRYAEITDSLTRSDKITKEKTKDAVFSPEQRNAVESARMQEVSSQADSKEYQLLQDKQSELYRQYAMQADALSKDINRLNSRMSATGIDDRRTTNFIPVPVPVNNAGSYRREPAGVSNVNKTDTVYIRDPIIIRDTIRITDTVRNLSPDNYVSRPVRVVPKPDTVLVKEFVKGPGFDYKSMPEENVLFALGKNTIQPTYRSKLDFIAGVLRKNRGLQVKITGHTDSSGSKAVNERLSLERAKAVAGYLMNKGVAEKQIELSSESFTNPAVSGNSVAARSQNRRVALRIVNTDE
jgi:outer membrane protein OmpA-like peptidoglycan-associated protein